MKQFRPVVAIYILPYLLILLAGVWYCTHSFSLAFFEGDSANYLIPPCIKQITGEWHKGERPMQYLIFIYFTLAKGYSLTHTIFMQRFLSIAGAVFLAGAWVVFIKPLRGNKLIYHILAWLMLATYISSPKLMYYSQLLAPESVCIFIMCLLIFCLSAVYAGNFSKQVKLIFTAMAIFINLYLSNPMPKCLFASILLELLLLYTLVNTPQTSFPKKLYAFLIPHIFFIAIVIIPEKVYKIDYPHEDRTNIEFEQMAYTHFDLLAADKSNFGLPDSLEDSLVSYLAKARLNTNGSAVLGFNNDELMWGDAADLVRTYYHDNEDSAVNFYKRLCGILITKYPAGLFYHISKQIYSFYWPNNKIHKNLHGNGSAHYFYNETRAHANDIDKKLVDYMTGIYCMKHNMTQINPDKYTARDAMIYDKAKLYVRLNMPAHPLAMQYPETLEKAGGQEFTQLPLLLTSGFFIFRWFDFIFIGSMLIFFIIRIYKREILKVHLITVLYVFMFLYVITVAIVHTFDIERFVTTIYPFILITTCMAIAYIWDEGTGLMARISKDQEYFFTAK